ncbi:HD-GYP domain-containing protein [Bacillus salitolerans]|uniref:HD-GYP domain-containing protein n=1 Tax=Bacillus salitolerans TaxID=1437434 RepID=A0ABW4LMF1_9BACI
MRLVPLERCESKMMLGQSIYDGNGRVLLAKGTELSDRLIQRLKKLHIYSVYIEDELSQGIEIVESVPERLRIEAVNVITDSLNTIAELKDTSGSNLQGMMKTGRAIRSLQKVFKDLLSCLSENRTVINLLATTKIHGNDIYQHSLNVTIYACQLAIENGLPLKNIEEIGLGAMLHDVGKVFISHEVLNKPGKLTEEEYEYVKKHTELGFDLLRKIHEIPMTVSHCALQHHEKLDGTGYPRGLKETEIHSYAKIISVADVFSALTSHRAYRTPFLPHEALEILYAGSGSQFESKQIQLFKGCIAIYPQGLTVKMNDGRIGIISDYNFHSVGRPKVRIIRDEYNQKIVPYEIDLSSKEHLTLDIIESDPLLY